jgi:NADP-dependent 3-hydroxy acid dehydrogenase YdfG
MNAYFNNKVIWITGASSGIGEALVKELAVKSNAKIILSSRREDQLYSIAQNAGLDKERYAVIPVDLENYTAMPATQKSYCKIW